MASKKKEAPRHYKCWIASKGILSILGMLLHLYHSNNHAYNRAFICITRYIQVGTKYCTMISFIISPYCRLSLGSMKVIEIQMQNAGYITIAASHFGHMISRHIRHVYSVNCAGQVSYGNWQSCENRMNTKYKQGIS